MAIAYNSIVETLLDDTGPGYDSTFTLTLPTHDADDLLAVVVCTSKSAASPAVELNTPAGWTKGPDIEAGNASAVRLTLFLKDGNGSESTVDITSVGSDDLGGGAFALRLTGGEIAASAIDVSDTVVQESGTDIDSPSVDASEADVLVLYAYCFDDDLASEADHDSDGDFSGTSRGYIETGTGEGNCNGFSMAVSTKTQGSGSTGICTWSTNDTDAGCAFTVVLKSAGAALPDREIDEYEDVSVDENVESKHGTVILDDAYEDVTVDEDITAAASAKPNIEVDEFDTIGTEEDVIVEVTAAADLAIEEFESVSLVEDIIAQLAHEFVLSLSDHFADGDATTFQLLAPTAKDTGDFQDGKIHESSNPADAIDLDEDKYTEVEFCFKATIDAGEVSYDFRIEGLDTYTVTPQLTITTGGGTLSINVHDCADTETCLV